VNSSTRMATLEFLRNPSIGVLCSSETADATGITMSMSIHAERFEIDSEIFLRLSPPQLVELAFRFEFNTQTPINRLELSSFLESYSTEEIWEEIDDIKAKEIFASIKTVPVARAKPSFKIPLVVENFVTSTKQDYLNDRELPCVKSEDSVIMDCVPMLFGSVDASPVELQTWEDDQLLYKENEVQSSQIQGNTEVIQVSDKDRMLEREERENHLEKLDWNVSKFLEEDQESVFEDTSEVTILQVVMESVVSRNMTWKSRKFKSR
jgi:hypothetical protein